MLFGIMGICLLAGASGLESCRKYEANMIFSYSSYYAGDELGMFPSDSAGIDYTVDPSGGQTIFSKELEVTVLSTDNTITSTSTSRLSSGTGSVHVTLFTNNTTGGIHRVKVVLTASDGRFTEQVVTIKVRNYQELLNDLPDFEYGADSLDYPPFANPNWIESYPASASQVAGFPSRFSFSSLGIDQWNSTELHNVKVDVNQVTGACAIPTQSMGAAIGLTGNGQLSYVQSNNQLKAQFQYSYHTSSGTQYVGHVSFH